MPENGHIYYRLGGDRQIPATVYKDVTIFLTGEMGHDCFVAVLFGYEPTDRTAVQRLTRRGDFIHTLPAAPSVYVQPFDKNEFVHAENINGPRFLGITNFQLTDRRTI